MFCTLLLAAPITYADTWTHTAPMNTVRYRHAAVRLLDGRVLLVGGSINGSANSAQIYEPVQGTWIAAATPLVDRGFHSATLLSDGRVLVAGGLHFFQGELSSAEIFTPATGEWTTAATMNGKRLAHGATRLPDGRILITGGYSRFDPDDNRYVSLATVEIYNPATNSWSLAANMNQRRAGHTSSLLADGRVLVAGGDLGSSSTASAEIYNPATNQWTAAAPLPTSRAYHTATVLSDGRLLFAGGQSFTRNRERDNSIAGAALYNPASNSWSVAAPMAEARAAHTATLLPDGKVVVTGGDGGGYPAFTVESYDPGANTWAPLAPLNTARAFHTATEVNGGQLLVAGGYGGLIGLGAASGQSTAELYDPAPNNRWASAASMNTPRAFHTATRLVDGRVLAAGGDDGTGSLSGAEIYDPALDTWFSGGALDHGRANHTATLLSDGRVLITGGVAADGSALDSAEIYDPATNQWTVAASMAQARAFHTATLLQDGRVLVAGGSNGAAHWQTAELYNPGSNSWSPAASMGVPRSGHGAGVPGNQPSNRVLVFGGSDGTTVLFSTEIYDAGSNSWLPAGIMQPGRIFFASTSSGEIFVSGGTDSSGHTHTSIHRFLPGAGVWFGGGHMSMRRAFHSLTRLSDGRVLIAGGMADILGAGIAVPFAQEFNPDPLVDSWRTVASLGMPRMFHTATILTDGRVLVVGGSGDGHTSLSSAEIYPVNQTIVFDTLFRRLAYGHPPMTLTATASSGLPVLFSTVGTCSVAGNVLTLDLPGACTVIASQPGDASFNPAPRVLKSFTIGKGGPTIVVTGGTFSYNGQPHAATAFAYGIGGIQDVLSPPVVITYEGVGYGPTTTPPTAVGHYAVTATFPGNDLYVSWSNGTGMTINPADMAPETTITDGPGSVFVNSATFSWSGTDDHTPIESLTYAYRLDPLEPEFSPFNAATTKVYTNLPNGSYTFHVKAKDLGGNEDPTPSVRTLFINAMPNYVAVPCFTDSLQAAVDAAKPGEILSVAGTCHENILISNAKERITIEGVGNAVIHGLDPARPAINLRGKGVLIQGLTIIGGSDGIHINRGSSAVLVRNRIHHTNGSGIMVSQSSFAVIVASTIEQNPAAGVVVTEGSAARLGFNSDLEIIGSVNFIEHNGVGMVVANGSSARIATSSISFNAGDGIVILGNSQADVSGSGIQANGADGIRILENSMAQLGDDEGMSIFESPNFSFAPNLGVGVRCATGSVVDGRQATLSGAMGAKSIESTCIDSLLP